MYVRPHVSAPGKHVRRVAQEQVRKDACKRVLLHELNSMTKEQILEVVSESASGRKEIDRLLIQVQKWKTSRGLAQIEGSYLSYQMFI